MPGSVTDDREIFSSRIPDSTELIKDEMIVLPIKMQKVSETPRPEHDRTASTTGSPSILSGSEGKREPALPARQPQPRPPPEITPSLPRQVPPGKIPTGDIRPKAESEPSGIPQHPGDFSRGQEIPIKKPMTHQPISPATPCDTRIAPRSLTGAHSQELARQRIERELQRQRMMALSGTRLKAAE